VRTHIDKALATTWGRGVLAADPRLQSAYDLLDADHNDPTHRLALIRQLEELYTFAPLINRTRRRDIGNFTTRKPETVTVEFTPEQADLHQNLINLMARNSCFSAWRPESQIHAVNRQAASRQLRIRAGPAPEKHAPRAIYRNWN